MTDVRIARLRKRYRLTAGDAEGRGRLDRVVARALDDALLDAALSDALARAGVREHEEVCVRRLHVAARLRRDDPEPRLAVAWSVAVARALDEAVRDGTEVVRYGSRHGALREMARRAPRGDLARAWAWRRLGLWTLGESVSPARAASEVVAALTRAPEAAPAVLLAAGDAGTLPILVRDAPPAAWHALAMAVLARLGAPRELAGALAATDDDLPNDAGVRPAVNVAPNDAVPDGGFAADDRPALDLPLARAFAAALRTSSPPPTLARSLAALAIAHAEPALLRDAPARVAREIARAAAPPAERTAVAPRDARTDTPSESRPESHQEARPDARSAPRDVAVEDEAAPADARPRARTEAAGVLFLLHLVRALDLPAVIAATGALHKRGVRWTLHRIAVDALGLSERDPAALAFAGLAPGSAIGQEEQDEQEKSKADSVLSPFSCSSCSSCPTTERAAVQALAARLAATLRVWLPTAPPNESDAELLARVCRRRGEIVADPAWIEAWLPLDEVDPAIRRAGLDVDPGWCPFIGAVVRFRYV